MVKKLSIGVLGVQGAISEHIYSMNATLKKTGVKGDTVELRRDSQIETIDALILPGGESTTISKILQKAGFYDKIVKRVKEDNLPIMGTCAGCILLSKKIKGNVEDVKTLNAMDIEVERNAFGRQKESFEKNIDIKGFSEPFPAVFIRAPIITKVWNDCKILSKIDNKIIMARQNNNYLAVSFHPELTDDLRIHKYFLDMIL